MLREKTAEHLEETNPGPVSCHSWYIHCRHYGQWFLISLWLMRLLLSRKLPVVKRDFASDLRTVHVTFFSLSHSWFKADFMEEQGKWEREQTNNWQSFLKKLRMTGNLCGKVRKLFFLVLVLPVLSMLPGWGHRGLEGASFAFSSPLLLVQQPVRVHLGASRRHSTREQPMQNNLYLAPQIPKVLKLSSCAFPAYFILMLVCVEFWWMYLLTFSGKQPAAVNTINDTQRTLGSPLSESRLLFQAH